MQVKIEIKQRTYKHFKLLATELRAQGFKCTTKTLIASALDIAAANQASAGVEQNKAPLVDSATGDLTTPAEVTTIKIEAGGLEAHVDAVITNVVAQTKE